MNNCRANVILNRMEATSCVGKREHMSMRGASDAAWTMSYKTGEQLVAYQCPFCCLFHVGHQKGRKRLESERKLKRYEFESGKRRAI